MSSQRRAVRKDDPDESKFGSITADYVIRSSQAPKLGAVPDTAEPGDEFLARKGDAMPSVMSAALAATGDAEVEQLKQEAAVLRKSLSDREAAFDEASLEFERIQAAWIRDTQDTVRKAEEAWKAKTAEQIRTIEARSREAVAKALADARVQSQSANQQPSEDARRQREELETLKTTLIGREAELTRLRTNAELARSAWMRETQEKLARAEQDWKAKETERLVAARTEWQENHTKSLNEARAQTQDAQEKGTRELRQLKDECTTAQKALAQCKSEFDTLRLEYETVQETWRKQIEEAEAKAAKAAKAPAPAARDPLSDTMLRKQASAELIEAKTRYEAAETALAQLRAQAARERQSATVAGYTAEEIASLRLKLERTEAELAKFRSGIAGIDLGHSQDGKVVIRPNRMREALRALEEDSIPEKKPNFVRDILAAAALAFIIVAMAPWVTPILPQSWQSQVSAMTGALEMRGDVSVASEDSAPASSGTTVADRLAAVMRDVNLRTDPSTGAAVISTLARGENVSVVERKGAWTRVRIDKTQQQGWVASSFLKAGEAE